MCKGLPGSGKSTFAKQYVLTHQNSIRINKDDLREMLHAGVHTKSNEKEVLQMRDLMTKMALSSKQTVIIDDTNFHPVHQETLAKIAESYGVPLIVQSFTNVPLEKCIEQDKKREKSVGKAVIVDMYRHYLLKDSPKIEHDPNLPNCIICDLDGTLALFGNKNPYDRDFENDEVNMPVALILNCIRQTGMGPKVIFVSGRKNKFLEQTEKFLAKNGFFSSFYENLFMPREDQDNRKDVIIKKEIYENEIKGKYNVLFVLDDRNQVVEFWRSLGLTCLQVAPGEF